MIVDDNMDPDTTTLPESQHIEISSRDTLTVSDNITENSDHTGNDNRVNQLTHADNDNRLNQLTCADNEKRVNQLTHVDCENRVDQLTCDHDAVASTPSGDNLTLDTVRDKIAGGYCDDKLTSEICVTEECGDSSRKRGTLEQGATDSQVCSSTTRDERTSGNVATAGVLTSQGMNTTTTKDNREHLFGSKQDDSCTEEDHGQIDVYDISQSDENSQPSVTFPKRQKLLHCRVASEKTVVTGSPNRQACGSLADGSNSRVVYMHSDFYVKTCSEMLRVPGRAAMVHSLIEAYGLLKYLKVVPPREATAAEILQFHTSDYIQVLENISKQEDEEKYDSEAEQFGLTYDCPVHMGVYNYAVLVAGATIQAAELLMDRSCDTAINWGGGWHHGKKDAASGFCYINDVVLGILKLREKYERVLYIDLDLHHGDGVEDAFCATSKVMTVSFHKYAAGFFPGSGAVQDVGVSRGRHYSVNLPLLDGIKDLEFCALFHRVVSRVRERFQPEVVVCQCGADGLAGDPMESFNLTPIGLGRCLHILQGWKKPLLLLGGGGYNPVNTAKCWTFLTALAVKKKLDSDIPDHQFFTKYGPDYELSVSVGNRKDTNSREHLQTVYRQVMDNISHICL